MFIKIRRDTLIILILAFMLIVSGRAMTYMAYASSNQTDQGVQISGVQIKGNDIIPTDSIRISVANAGFRTGSYIQGDTLVTSKRSLPLSEAITNAEEAIMLTPIPGTTVTPIVAADVKVDTQTGIVTVNVIENFANLNVNSSTG
ncbi:MAG: hypothetical protein K8E24_008815 [Methanobacterium paludis]|uniref:Uncharacterized protein n=1 Tax=Methanobacterium paludis (strain DSM 25820 / JCM 18151 / SWAN1) TaxID=868131 RepID=F6D445_METPW|nr:hypothetical protein [Methanobacterium paludis]AEG17467.1 hypothetical protein MSWAN_0425 [Methanobacterium paludis]MCE7698905.1 hypothetical protein [Methanobacterium paludis]